MSTKFTEDCVAVLNVAMPAAERKAKAAGRVLQPSERAEVARLVRESLDGNRDALEALKTWTGTPVAESAKGPEFEKAVKEELVRRCQVLRLMKGRGPTAAEQADLEKTIRERWVSRALTEAEPLAFGRAVMEGRLGGGRSPGLVASVRTVGQITEDVGDFSAAAAKLATQLPAYQRDEIYDQTMVDRARTVSFGGQRLDG
jgi:hypothetical protein